MGAVRLVARPIEVWPGELTREPDRERARFTAPWSDTVDLLRREVGMLTRPGREVEVVLQLALGERDCRLDGWIRANARPAHPGVVLSFESVHGPLRYATDRFGVCSNYVAGQGMVTTPAWQANVRAIALGLEALRAVDRYGISRGGEQYRGWNALPPGTPMPAAAMTVDDAADFLIEHGEVPDVERPANPEDLLDPGPLQAEIIEGYYRRAAKRLHPDAGGGDPSLFRQLTEAHELLRRSAR